MPAYRERVYLCPGTNGQAVWLADFPVWWERAAFFKQFASRQVDTGNPAYDECGLLLTQGEALAWDMECRAAFASDPRSKEAAFMNKMRAWELKLREASWVIVESFEWESGLE